MNNKKNTLIVLVGPTAIGKTKMAIEIAQKFNTQIISADSRQCFKELTIGVAKPSQQQLSSVAHYFINSHSIVDDVNVGIYEKIALEKCSQIFENSNIAVCTGGTGLYINALCNGIDEMPIIDPTIRQNIIDNYQKNGLQWLQNEVEVNDPLFWNATKELQNPQRLMRALEIITSTGKSIISFKTNPKATRNFNIIKIGLETDREVLNYRINCRVDAMINDGLINEVEGLQQHQHLNALQTVGYKEIFEYLNNKNTLAKAIEQIKINTRHYAKRQMTWFKKDTTIHWFLADKLSQIFDVLEENISKN
jgi:tRNA dimethylallyltransferase